MSLWPMAVMEVLNTLVSSRLRGQVKHSSHRAISGNPFVKPYASWLIS